MRRGLNTLLELVGRCALSPKLRKGHWRGLLREQKKGVGLSRCWRGRGYIESVSSWSEIRGVSLIPSRKLTGDELLAPSWSSRVALEWAPF